MSPDPINTNRNIKIELEDDQINFIAGELIRGKVHINSASEAAYIIGGYQTREIIAEFKNDSWRQFGTLTKGRDYHGSIAIGDAFMVIGGNSVDSCLLGVQRLITDYKSDRQFLYTCPSSRR